MPPPKARFRVELRTETGYFSRMSFKKVLAELPSLSFDQRQLPVRRALELNDPVLTPQDEALVEKRLAGHHRTPESSISLGEMKMRLRSQFNK
jgi:hypothetical protein